MTFGEFIRHPSTGPLLDSMLADNRKVDAINAGVAIYHTCLCGSQAHLDDVRTDGVCAYRCPNPSCVYRVALVAPRNIFPSGNAHPRSRARRSNVA